MPEINHKITREFIVVSFDISGVRIDLFKQASISVVFECDNGEIIYKEVVLKGDDYLKWGDDDDYIVEYIEKNIYDILDE